MGPVPRTSVAKNGSAVTEIVKKSRAPTAAVSATASVRSAEHPGAPSAWRPGRHGEERAGVDQQADLRPAGTGEHAAEQRSGGHAEVAGRLDVAVGLRDALLSRRRGHERELGRGSDRDAGAEQEAEHEQRPAASRR